MRYLVTIAVILTIFFLVQMKPESVSQVTDRVSRAVVSLNFDKKLDFQGLTVLDPAELTSVLPMDHSIWWWLLNPNQISMRLAQNPLIERATAASCSSLLVDKWGCFSIEVTERTPAFIAATQIEYWLVGGDGSFIAPIPNSVPFAESLSKLQLRFGRLRIIRGLSSVRSSPDLVLARFDYAKNAIELIEQHSGLELEWTELKQNGEILGKFKPYELTATFDYSQDKPDGIIEESKRLKALLEKFKGRENLIKEIDLAFNKMAVVRLFSDKQ